MNEEGSQSKERRFDIYKAITDQYVEALKKGDIPWERPWVDKGGVQNGISSHPYRGINMMSLSYAARKNEWEEPFFLTKNQINKNGGRINKGEKGNFVTFYKPKLWTVSEEVENPETGEMEMEDVQKMIPFLRYTKVWNVSQTNLNVENLPAYKAQLEEDSLEHEFEPVDLAEMLVDNIPNPPKIEHGGSSAFYRPSEDLVQMPVKEDFKTSEGYYSTLFHELGHSTGHETRLDRPEVTRNSGTFGDSDYSKEELVAEMTAGFLSELTGIRSDEIRENSESYINNWIKKLESEPRMLVKAASSAQKAVEHMIGEEIHIAENEEQDEVKSLDEVKGHVVKEELREVSKETPELPVEAEPIIEPPYTAIEIERHDDEGHRVVDTLIVKGEVSTDDLPSNPGILFVGGAGSSEIKEAKANKSVVDNIETLKDQIEDTVQRERADEEESQKQGGAPRI